MNKIYMCIDLKSFYASVECVLRGLDPLNTNLVVADASRTEKTICLAVSPALKSFGIPGRPRLFEVIQGVKKINTERLKKIKFFKNKSYKLDELLNDKYLELDYIIAKPQMKKYIEVSSKIYSIYLKFFSSDDILVYSIDEVFIDLTSYLKAYGVAPEELCLRVINEVLKQTGITATAGIGTNMYLAKVAMDILAKKMKPNRDGVRIAYMDQKIYKERLWDHRPISDFWRIGRGISEKLEHAGLYTMRDIAKCSLGEFKDKYNEDFLYNLFGVNAELIIDHAWGYEPCTIMDIKKYKPLNRSLGSGQVLHCPMDFDGALLIVKEMADQMSLDLVKRNAVTNQLVLTIGYDVDNDNYNGELKKDYLGRLIPKSAHGTCNLNDYTSSTNIIRNEIKNLYKRITDNNLMIRRINISCIIYNKNEIKNNKFEQIDLFNMNKIIKNENFEKEEKAQRVIIDLKNKFGKNAVLKGMNLEEGSTMKERNEQIGGHKA